MRYMIFFLIFTSCATNGQAFHKCVGPDGKVTFTDVACPKHKAQQYQKSDLEALETAEGTSDASVGDTDSVLEEKSVQHPASQSHRSVAQR